MIFGSAQTVEQYHGNPRVQAHGPGFSKILIGDDMVDRWEEFLDVMVESVYVNGGRSCINASGIWASRHTKEIAQAIAEKIGPVDVKPTTDPEAGLAAFTNPAMATGTWGMIEDDLKEDGVTDMTAAYGSRLIEQERCAYLRPMVVHCSYGNEVAMKEYMFPFVSVVECPEDPDDQIHWPDAGWNGTDGESEFGSPVYGCCQHRPAQHRPDTHESPELAPAP